VSVVLVVCTGNICRSPMAEGLLTAVLNEHGISDVQVVSCGVVGWEGSAPMPEAVDALLENGIDISGHVARRLDPSMIRSADLVLAMAGEHRESVVRHAPEARGRTFTMKEFVHLLDHLPAAMGPSPANGADRLHEAVGAAAALREEGGLGPARDEDVADPLGLGVQAFRASAWEIGELSRRVVDGVFGEAGSPRLEQDPGGPAAVAAVAAGSEGGDSMKDYVADWEALRRTDPEIADAMTKEVRRERSMLRLIASENYASPSVLAALGSTMNNKYAEGYPGRRYYGGCEFVDVAENLAIDRAKLLFGADHANVQPHAGASANLAVYGAFLDPKDPSQKVLGLVLPHGGHLTHGSPVNFSGKWFSFIGYEVDRETELIDMDRVRELALEHRPRIILAGYTAYPRIIDFEAFRRVADEVEAILMVDASHFIGLVAGGAYPSPVPYADIVTFTTHKTLRGPRGAMILCRAEHAKAIDKAVFPMMQGGPLEHCIAAKAVALKEAMQPEFREYADRVVRTARALASSLAEEGLRVVSGGTDSHLALVDLQPIGMTGADAEAHCEGVGIALNKNAVPFDPLPPTVGSGIRVGTPGPATLGMDEAELKEVGRIIGDVLKAPGDETVKARARERVRDLMTRFPPYPG
jgi:glycine hydroxymethyltransferase